MKMGGAVYIMTNKNNTTLYIGVTEELIKRVYEHKSRIDSTSFTYKYNLDKLVYYEFFHSVEEAIPREKQLKAGNREKKLKLINSINPGWKDLWEEIQNW
ncbi:GIY-YIG nuclease family protein [Algoriphagus jejuensis]|uniref:GIY-YIG nuclease family protein n=1 Tax=Algoriphagus jejuensis TaxID=419934 RepID=A0ABP3Y8P7_9BACT